MTWMWHWGKETHVEIASVTAADELARLKPIDLVTDRLAEADGELLVTVEPVLSLLATKLGRVLGVANDPIPPGLFLQHLANELGGVLSSSLGGDQLRCLEA